MSAYSILDVQEAIYSLLSTDSTLLAMVTGVYDHTPQDTAFPYVTIGEAECRDVSNLAASGVEANFGIHIFSREAGHKETHQIMERIYTLLHNTSPAVSGQTVVSMRIISADVMLERDGFTYRGMMKLRVVTFGNG